MKLVQQNKGYSIVIVLIFSFSLLVLASAYLSYNSNNKTKNEKLYQQIQADFLAQGIVNKAILKFKRRPAEFYYAYYAHKAGRHPQLMESYQYNDPTLNGRYTDQFGNKYNFHTRWELISNERYATDAIRLTVIVEHVDQSNNVVMTRTKEQTFVVYRRSL